RVMLNWCVNKFLDFCEGDNLVKFGTNFPLRHAKNCAVEKDVFSASQFGVETSSYFKQARDSPIQDDSPIRGSCYAAQYLEERALASTVSTNDSENFTFLDLEIDVF